MDIIFKFKIVDVLEFKDGEIFVRVDYVSVVSYVIWLILSISLLLIFLFL